MALQRRMLRKAFQHFQPGLSDVGFDVIENMRQAIETPPRSGLIELPRSLQLIIENATMAIERKTEESILSDWPKVRKDRIELAVTGNTYLEGGWLFRANILEGGIPDFPEIIENKDLFTAYLDRNFCQNGILVGRRQPGDLFAPLGMNGHRMKVSDFMINVKMPKLSRDSWPLLFSGGELVWIPGYQVSEKARVKYESQEIIVVQLLKVP